MHNQWFMIYFVRKLGSQVENSSDSSMYLGNILHFKCGIYKNRLVSKKPISFSIFLEYESKRIWIWILYWFSFKKSNLKSKITISWFPNFFWKGTDNLWTMSIMRLRPPVGNRHMTWNANFLYKYLLICCRFHLNLIFVTLRRFDSMAYQIPRIDWTLLSIFPKIYFW